MSRVRGFFLLLTSVALAASLALVVPVDAGVAAPAFAASPVGSLSGPDGGDGDAPVVPVSPLDGLREETAESNESPTVPLPDAVGDLPQESTDEVDLGGAWRQVEDAPVEVRSAPAPVLSGSADSPLDRVRVSVERPQDLLVGVVALSVDDVAGGSVGEGSVADGGVQLRLDYGDFEQLYGGDWSERLEIQAYPACYLVTPERPECAQGVAVESSNDVGLDRLVFTTVPSREVPGVGADAAGEAPIGEGAGGADAGEEPGTEPSGVPGVEGPPPAGGAEGRSGTAGVASSEVPSGLVTEPVAHAGGGRSVPSSVALPITARTGGAGGAVPVSVAAGAGAPPVYTVRSGQGNFVYTPFSASSSWQVGAGTGEFSWSYPFDVPAASAGATPSLSLNYSSGLVDAMTSENGEVSPVGVGWSELTPGSITRSFGLCKDDDSSTASQFAVRADQCWTTAGGKTIEELSLTLNGHSSKLRRLRDGVGTDGPAIEYRLYDDPGWRLYRYGATGSTRSTTAGADDNAEKWEVQTPSGVKYFFGSLPGNDSVWTVPVYGNDTGEPCRVAGAMGQSWCQQAWRWNLDRVVDAMGNETRYTYEAETNYYKLYSGSNGQYTRGGNFKQVDYGILKTSSGLTPAHQVVKVALAGRCLVGVKDTPQSCDGVSAQNQWPDVPIDLVCSSGSSQCLAGPSFFTKRRVYQVQTFTKRGVGATTSVPVSTYTLYHRLPDSDAGDSQVYDSTDNGADQADLWLLGIRKTGNVGGGSAEMARTLFDGSTLANRVVPANGEGLRKFRISAIRNELGGRIDVTYGHQAGKACDEAYTTNRAKWTSTRECFLGSRNATKEWFNKYVVTRTVLSDDSLHYRLGTDPASGTSLGESQVFDYSYSGSPAWRFGKSRVVPDLEMSYWNDWRGYGIGVVSRRRVDDQVATNAELSKTVTVQFRGMDGARKNTQSPIERVDANLSTTFEGAQPVDAQWLNGRVAETTLISPAGAQIRRTYTDYDSLRLVTGDADQEDPTVARIVYTKSTNDYARKGADSSTNDSFRTHQVDYDVYSSGAENNFNVRDGQVAQIYDRGDTDAATAGGRRNDHCTVMDYQSNQTLWLVAPNSMRDYTGECTTIGTTPGGTQTAWATQYHGDTPAQPSTTLTKPLITLSRVRTDAAAGQPRGAGVDNDLTGLDVGDGYLDTATTYDTFGRPTMVTDPRGHQTATEYNSPDPGDSLRAEDLTERVRSTVYNTATGSPNLVTTTTVDPATGQPIKIDDTNTNTTRAGYDALGRLTKVWLPGNIAAYPAGVPSLSYTYKQDLRDRQDIPLANDAPNAVITTALKDLPGANGAGAPASTITTNTLIDGWGREIETQSPSPESGRLIVSDTGYNDYGQAYLAVSDYAANDPGLAYPKLINPDPATLNRYTLTSYDAADRPVEVAQMNTSTQYRTSTTQYLGDRTVATPPQLGRTTTYTDVWDRPLRVVQALNADGTGAGDEASYTYTTRGDLDTITKPLCTSNCQNGTPVNQTATWDYDYDWASRRINAIDPDIGTSRSVYDETDNLIQNTTYDARINAGTAAPAAKLEARIRTGYDDLNRPTTRTDATSLTATQQLARWTYDTAPKGVGMPATTETTINTSAERPGLINNGLPAGNSPTPWHTSRLVTGYDVDGNQLGLQVRYPDWLTGETGNVGTTGATQPYANTLAADANVTKDFGWDYNENAQPTKLVYPTTPGIAGSNTADRTITHTYDPTGRYQRTDGPGAQTLGFAAYNNIGETTSLASWNTTSTLTRGYTYEPTTGLAEAISATKTDGTPANATAPSTTNPSNLLTLNYAYDLADNPTKITGTLGNPGGAITKGAWCYAYDGLNRLTDARAGAPDTTTSNGCISDTNITVNNPLNSPNQVTGAEYHLGYTYTQDRLATTTSTYTTVLGGTPTTATATNTWDATHPHQTTNTATNNSDLSVLLTQIGLGNVLDQGLPTSGDYTYDGSGRATAQPGMSTRYDIQGNPTATNSHRLLGGLPPGIAGPADATLDTSAAYDADGIRIARRSVTKPTCGLMTTTVYLEGLVEITRSTIPQLSNQCSGVTATSTDATTSIRHYTTANRTPLATRTADGDTWEHSDAQGNLRLTQTQDGTTTRPTYYPYGNPTTGPPATAGNHGYLNKTHDPNGTIRLDHRNFTPRQNLLTTPDPLLEPSDPQTLNPYAYARNNPIGYGDGSGLFYDPEGATTNYGNPHQGSFGGAPPGPPQGYQPGVAPSGYEDTRQIPNEGTVDFGAAAKGLPSFFYHHSLAFATIHPFEYGKQTYHEIIDPFKSSASGCADHKVSQCALLFVELVIAGETFGKGGRGFASGAAKIESRAAANSGRGLGDLGGVISQTGRNGAGGRIFTSSGPINQNDFAGIVNNGVMRGDDVHILTGAHGLPNGTMVADASIYADDVARFGDLPGVMVHDVASMSPAAISGVLQRPGTIIGGFCDSTACLGAFR